MSTTCKDCRWFSNDGGPFGECHRYPPNVRNPNSECVLNSFPVVAETDWCGEFEAAQETLGSLLGDES